MTTTQRADVQRFYCEGCREWHETLSLLAAVKREAEEIRLEEERRSDDDDNE